MKFKEFILLLKTQIPFGTPNKTIAEFFENKEVFFMLSSGRTGTKFLSNLLNKDINAVVLHEPIRLDAKFNPLSINNPELASKYIKEFRKKYIYFLLHNQKFNIYGEINPRLRYLYPGLQSNFSANFFHLVRNGKDVVRSLMSRSHYKTPGHTSFKFKPKKISPYYDKWKYMDRFEKICWYWMHANKYLRKNIGRNPIKFEYLISNYNYLKEKLLNTTGIKISKKTYMELIENPEKKNQTQNHIFPSWENWSQNYKKKFISICGEEMSALNYRV